MSKEEVAFPRGGKKQTKASSSDADTFEVKRKQGTAAEWKDKKEKKKQSRKRQNGDESPFDRPSKHPRVTIVGVEGPLKGDSLCTDLVVLACVKTVYPHSISVNLPGNRNAFIPITNVSDAYTQQLSQLTKDEEQDENIAPVADLFKTGFFLPVAIKSITEAKKGEKKISCSCKPSDINGGIPKSEIQDGMLLMGNVSSVEDHGYRIDTGIKGLHAFLKNADAKTFVTKHCSGEQLCVGHPLWCVVNMKDKKDQGKSENRVINVTIESKMVETAKLQKNPFLNCLLPGMKTTVHVTKVCPQGLMVTVGTFEGLLHGSHLPSDVSSYSVGKSIEAAILYVHPESKTIHLTALPRIVKQSGNAMEMFTDVNFGDIFEAKIHKSVSRKGLYLKLSNGNTCFAALSQLKDDAEAPDIKDYVVGTDVKCRVLGFNHMENLILVSLKQSVLEEKFLTISSLNTGDFVEATVVDVLDNGLYVKLSRKIYSFIHKIHLSNVPIHHLKKKFDPGMVLKCRVTRVDSKRSKVWLTHKAAMMETKNVIPATYSQLTKNSLIMGFISSIKDGFVIVNFFNKVHGIVMMADMGMEKDQIVKDQFYTGQVVRCRVLTVHSEREKLRLSFVLTLSDEKAKQVIEPLNLTPGLITEAKIIAIGDKSYTVKLSDQSLAILPFDHLSDFPDVAELRKLTLKKKYVLDKVTFFQKRQPLNIFTMKESFIKSADEKIFAETFEDLEVGMVLPGVVKTHQDYGFFIELAGGHTGLCPSRTLPKIHSSAMTDLFPIGRSLLTRIVVLDKEKKRFLGSVLKQDYMKDLDSDDHEIFHDYLKAKNKAMQQLWKNVKLRPYGDVAVGSTVEVTVTSIYEKGILCDLGTGLKAIATHHHLGGVEPETGKQYPAVVLDFDFHSPCFEVSLDPKLCKAVNTSKQQNNKSSQVRIGQALKATLLLMKKDFLLMSLKGHGSGKLVYIPTKKHFNDVYISSDHKIGMYSNVTITGNVEGVLTGALKLKGQRVFKKLNEDGSSEKEKENVDGSFKKEKEKVDVRNLPLHNVQVGDVIEATVKSVHSLQMNLTADRVYGRVHITEISDDVTQTKSPLYSYHNGDTVKAKVIGLRNMESKNEYMPISRPRATRTLLECSLIESKMDKSDPKELMSEEFNTYIGADMTVYVIQVDATKIWVQATLMHQGSISIFYASKKMKVLNNIQKYFKIGQPLRATVIGKTTNEKISFSLIGEEVNPKKDSEVTALITGVKNSKQLSARLCNGAVGLIDTYPGAHCTVGKFVECWVDKMSKSGLCELSMKDGNNRKRKSSLSESEKALVTSAKKTKKDCLNGEDSEVLTNIEVESRKEEKSKNNKKSDLLIKKGKPSESTNPTGKETLAIEGFAWSGDIIVQQEEQEVSDDDDDDDVITPGDSNSKKKRKREDEKTIEDYERKQLEGKAALEDVDDFERLVLQSPNSSMVWLRYMAYHLEHWDAAKARAVAEKAITTIAFREEQELKNVWLAYLNLETMYGEANDVKKLLDRAKMYNDPLDIQLKMCGIYLGANKIEEANQQYTLLIRKFRKEKTVWKSYAQFLFQQGKQDSARNLLKQCLSALEKRDHVETISRFAHLEFSHGNPERGRTMFENLLASYPGRTDIWSVYVDMVVKSGDTAGGRQLLERAVKQKLNAKKVSFLIQKFIKFEETHGTEDQVQIVKDMAVSLLDS